MNKWVVLTTVLLSHSGFSGTMGAVNDSPNSGVFLGLGGSYNSVKLDQYLDPVIGTSDVFDSSGVLISTGSANGPAVPFHNTQTTFAPFVQTGYFTHYRGNDGFDFIYGAKFQYQYLGIVSTDSNLIIPQQGSFTNTSAAPSSTTFTGRATIGSIQTKINHELALIPFIGHALTKKTHAYIGVGPSVTGIGTTLYNVTGYADVNGSHLNVSGTPTNFSSSKWLWGGVGQIGMAYFLTPSWSLDLNYTYSVTGDVRTSYRGTFENVQESTANVTRGTLYGETSQRITVQSVMLSINKVFDV